MTAGRDRPHTRRSLFDKRDRRLDEEVTNGVANFFKRHLDFFCIMCWFRLPAWVVWPQSIALRNNVLFGRSSNDIFYNRRHVWCQDARFLAWTLHLTVQHQDGGGINVLELICKVDDYIYRHPCHAGESDSRVSRRVRLHFVFATTHRASSWSPCHRRSHAKNTQGPYLFRPWRVLTGIDGTKWHINHTFFCIDIFNNTCEPIAVTDHDATNTRRSSSQKTHLVIVWFCIIV